jgi:hypothetical protein
MDMQIELRPSTIWVLPCALGEVPVATTSGSGTQCVQCGPSTISLWLDPAWKELFVDGKTWVNATVRAGAECHVCPDHAVCTGERGRGRGVRVGGRWDSP